LNFDHLSFLNGAYDNIPLRSRYVDLVIIVGVPERNCLENSLREWGRVLKQDGALAIVTPTILVRKYDDPLSIGNFIEKYEREVSEKRDYTEARALEALLEKFFHKVEEKQIIHMTIFSASKARALPQR
jgi:ubiquinone/menaquinone biosynthesis C-methylase UbiE